MVEIKVYYYYLLLLLYEELLIISQNYGNQTFDENMPDTMGLKTAFKAYKRREIINGVPELKLPGLGMFDNDQLFFLSSANVRIPVKMSSPLLEISLSNFPMFQELFISLSLSFLSYGAKPEIPRL